LFRRVDIADVVEAHRRALGKACDIGFDRFIISGATPFVMSDVQALAENAPAVVAQYVPEYRDEFTRRGWQMFSSIDRVYDSTHAQKSLGWQPQYTFAQAIDKLSKGHDYRSDLTRLIGSKGYHAERFEEGPYPLGSF